MKRNTIIGLGALALLIVGVLIFQGWKRAHDAAWEADVQRVLAVAKVNRAGWDSAAYAATLAENAAGAAMLRAAALEQRANALAYAAARIRTRIDTVTVPADALPYTQPRDSLIAVLDQQIDTLTAALGEQKAATTALTLANAALHESDRLKSIVIDSMTAVLERRPHAHPWIPEIRLGIAAGLDARDYKVFVGPAVQLGWKLNL